MEDGSTLDVTMTINETEQGYTGNLSSYMGAVDLDDLVIEDGKLTSNFDLQGYKIDFHGTFEGATIKESPLLMAMMFPLRLLRKNQSPIDFSTELFWKATS